MGKSSRDPDLEFKISYCLGYSIATALPKSSALDVWTFVSVFGLPQWMTYLSLLFLMFMGLLITDIFQTAYGMHHDRETIRELGTERVVVNRFLFQFGFGRHF